MGLLSIGAYARAEQAARAGLSIPEIMAYSPAAFESVGYPTRVVEERELLRYADHNFEAEIPKLLAPGSFFRGACFESTFTEDEADLIRGIQDHVVAFTRDALGQAVKPLTNLLVQIGLFRVIDALARKWGRERLSIFEIGPGSGYLGALLIQSGHRYASFDVTQSLYLWQNRLYHALAPDRFAERIVDPFDEAAPPAVVHLPWWDFLAFHKHCPLKADIVISNSNLGEMRRLALKYALRVSHILLEDSPMGLFVYASPGMPHASDAAAIENEFASAGFTRKFEQFFHGFTSEGNTLPEGILELEEHLPLYNPSEREGRLSAATVMGDATMARPLDLEFAKFIHGWSPPEPG